MRVEYLPVAVQTLYADLVERAWRGDLAELTAAGGHAYAREVKGRQYWYWRPATQHGTRPSARYIGPDTDVTRTRLAELREAAHSLRERRSMVSALRAARLPAPDPLSGRILEALAKAGVFRLRTVLVGSVAFQSYAGLLGVRIPATLSRTSDVDIAQFHALSLGVEDRIDRDLEAVLKGVDQRFESVMDPTDSRRVLRYALRAGNEELFALDVLSPLRGPERGRLTRLPALRSDAQLLRFLDYLLYQEINAAALYGPGIPINVPDPARYALHKLIVAQLRTTTARSQAKARKDLEQAAALIGILAQLRPDELRDAWQELSDRGASWREKADRSLQLLPEARAVIEGAGAGHAPAT